MSRLELHGVEKRYGALKVLPPTSATVAPGEALGLWGPTGCGKTTLLRIVAGLTEPSSGTVRIGGELANNPGLIMAPAERGIGMVFQDLALWPHMSARRHLEYTLGATVRNRGARRDQAAHLLQRVYLTEHAEKRPSMMSRGQRQRLAIARALCNEPAILLLDEPVSSQDAKMAARLCDLFAEQRTSGKAIAVASHDRAFLRSLCTSALIFGEEIRCVPATDLPDR